MANEAYRAVTAQDLIKMYNLDALITDRKQTKATNEKIQVLEETSNSLKDFAEEVEKQIEDLEKIADGKITTYYYSGVPTLTTYPTNEWALDEYENHIGDMYYDKETGYAYKFLFDNELNEYLWRRETNPELIEALAKANSALEMAESAQETANNAQGVANSSQGTANNAIALANSKMQVFIQTPYPPYKIGDLWFKDDKVIYRCRAEKESGSYSETDWTLATDFTNDDYAKNVEEQFNQYKVTVEKDYATKVQLETTKDEINLSVEGLTTKTETLEEELKGKADVLNVTELTQRVDLVQSATELNVTAIEKLETNDVEQAEKMAEFEVAVNGISLEVSEKVGEDEIVSSINNAVKDGKGVIELVSNSVVIDSDNFKLDKTGRIDATSGEVGGFDLGTESFTADIAPKKDYTQEDVSKLARYTVEGTGLTDEEKELYDVTGDGLLKVNDVTYMQSLISANVSTTKPGKLEINSKNPTKTILIKDGDGKEVVNLSLLGITTPKLKVGGYEIIDSGSNSNGSWIKWADGTMIVRQEYTSSSQNTTVTMGSLKRVGISIPPNFPVSFIEPPNVQITLHNCWLGWLMGCEYEPTINNATNGAYIPIASAEQRTFEAIKINILAVGRWK